MKVLVVGGGGREHAITKALSLSNVEIFAAAKNRNPGILRLSKDFLQIDETRVEEISVWARQKGVELAVIGPEAPLDAGIVDKLHDLGMEAIGPSKAVAQIETSKEFARNLMRDHKIPGLIDYWTFDTPQEFEDWAKKCDFEFVIKPIGLTGGKGVRVWGDHFKTKDEAAQYAREISMKKIGGTHRFLVEEKIEGEEFSLQVFADGRRVVPMPLVQDHKRAYEGDEGPNTGGMGSYSDVDHRLPFLRKQDYEQALSIMRKTEEAMKADGTPFRGILYGGFIATRDGVRVLEFNARFADPESMNVLPLLTTDILQVFDGMVTGHLTFDVKFQPKATVCKYVVPMGYGTSPAAGERLHVDETMISATGAELYYAAVDQMEDGLRTTASRSVAIVGIGDSIEEAEAQCESALAFVKGNIYVRHDIGKSSLVRKRIEHMNRLRGGQPHKRVNSERSLPTT